LKLSTSNCESAKAHRLPENLLKTGPYESLDSEFIWRSSIAAVSPDHIRPISGINLKFSEHHKVATAGSCFAQHVSKQLLQTGFNYFVAERGSPFRTEEYNIESGYGVFSARYGNIYTARQFLQLVQRSLGLAHFADQIYGGPYGLVDGFRPGIFAKQGFSTAEALLTDRYRHLERVKVLLEQADIFVFTFGLTESWISVPDGSVLPLCPGHSFGEYDSQKHVFKNMTTAEVVDDFTAAVDLIRRINPDVRFVLTVSPVPLVATMSGNHILHANTYSKSVLRVACEELASNLELVSYFPSYEIITGTYNTHLYYDDSRRCVTQQGINHVMRVFFETYTDKSYDEDGRNNGRNRPSGEIEVVCDEDQLFEALAMK